MRVMQVQPKNSVPDTNKEMENKGVTTIAAVVPGNILSHNKEVEIETL